MNLARALRLAPAQSFAYAASSAPAGKGSSIAFVGAGGKSTAMFQLARLLAASGPVIVTASSHLGAWQVPLADQHIVATELRHLEDLPAFGVVLVTGPAEGDRTLPLDPTLLQHLQRICREGGLPVLIEADGSRGHPLKAPAAHEPPIPEFAELVIVVVGLSGLGQPLTEQSTHRPEQFAVLSGLAVGETITVAALERVLSDPQGGGKGIPAAARRILLLNQAETPELQAAGGALARALLPHFDAVLVGSLREENFQTFERTAGIILAAGGSARLGRPKQLLNWRGQPFVRAVAQVALDAGLDPVILVTGAHTQEVEAAVKGLPVQVALNVAWSEGQGSSIRVGLRQLIGEPKPEAGAGVFLLVDQPQISVSILKALNEAHTLELYPIVAPLVLDQRANPVLFDRITFEALLELQGDVGGRAIFDKYHVEYLPWHDDRLLLDVDTPEQYQRLVQDETL